MSDNPLVSVIIPVKDAALYLPSCLEALKKQTLSDFELIVFDNHSTDDTVAIALREFPHIKLIKSDHNYFVGGAANRALKHANGDYILVLCADVILKEDFLQRGVEIFEFDKKIGVLQAKILKFSLEDGRINKTNVIDTTGFLIFKSGRMINRGHGEIDEGQFQEGAVFSYEGAAGFFRWIALEDAMISVKSAPLSAPDQRFELFDEDFSWMADDIDLGWRLRNLGWENYYNPNLVCWYDRKTTKRLSQNKLDFIRQRKDVPPLKRRLDFQNTILTLIKNLPFKNFLRHFFSIMWRQISLGVYVSAFEFSSIPAFWGIMRLLPKILNKRREIMRKRKISFQEMEKWLV